VHMLWHGLSFGEPDTDISVSYHHDIIVYDVGLYLEQFQIAVVLVAVQ
jgi:hypothetical protein